MKKRKGDTKMRMNKKNRLTITALALLLAIGVVGGTFAWFKDSHTFENTFKTGKYQDEITEIFTPPTDWRPGVETEKEVTVKNTGNVPMVVRVKFSEEWTKGTEHPSNKFTYTDAAGVDQEELAALKNLYTDNVAAAMTTDKWYVVYDSDNNIQEAYYIGVLESGESTPKLLKSVTMNPNIPVEPNSTAKYYKIDKTTGVETEITDETKYGEADKVVYTSSTSCAYSESQYVLNITAETVQADEAAVKEVWNDLSDSDMTALINALKAAGLNA